jgi:hypothetical protein
LCNILRSRPWLLILRRRIWIWTLVQYVAISHTLRRQYEFKPRTWYYQMHTSTWIYYKMLKITALRIIQVLKL